MNWNLPKQTIFNGGNQVGDCWRCCIAAILQLPAETVPHFAEEAKRSPHMDMDEPTQKWLNERGFCLVRIPIWAQIEWMDREYEPLPMIACGPTERSRGLHKHHAVVMVNREIVYDPHPSNSGLTYLAEYYMVVPLRNNFPALVAGCNCGGLCPACAEKKAKAQEGSIGLAKAVVQAIDEKREGYGIK